MQSLTRVAPESLPKPEWPELEAMNVFLANDIPGFEQNGVFPDLSTVHILGSTAVEPFLAEEDTPAAALIELVPEPPPPILKALQEYPKHLLDKNGQDRYGTRALVEAGKNIGGTLLFVAESQPGLITSTVNPKSGLQATLHIDNRDQLPYTQSRAHGSRRRFVINGGPGYREVYACFPDVVTLHRDDAIRSKPLALDGSSPPTGQERLRFYAGRHFGRIVCVRFVIPPGTGYIMNTDAIGHDGGTRIATEPSLVACYLGHWARGAFSLAA